MSEATDFLAALWGSQRDEDESYELRAFSAGGLPLSKFYRSITELLAEAARLSPSRDVYMAVNPRVGQDGSKDGVRHIVAVYGEFDSPVALRSDPTARTAWKIAKAAELEAHPCPPTIVVDSGGGLHGYWLLTFPLLLPRIDDARRGPKVEAVEAVLKALIPHLGASRESAEIGRILRLPGTFNRKPEYPDGPLPVRLVALHPERRYAFEDLADAFPPVASPSASEPREPRPPITPPAQAKLRAAAGLIAAYWPSKGDGAARHAELVLPLAGYLSQFMEPDDVVAIMEAGIRQAGDEAFLRERRQELVSAARTSNARVSRDGKRVGLPTLAKRFPDLARVVGDLWPQSFLPADRVVDTVTDSAVEGTGPLPEEPPVWQPRLLLAKQEQANAITNTWLDRYMAYAQTRTDAPVLFHEALGLVILSAVVGRRAVLRLSQGDVYPSLWVMLLADSSIYRKSTSLDLARDMIGAVSEDLLAPNDFTPQRFTAVMAENDGRPLALVRDEFSGFYDGLNRMDYMAGLKELLCDIYDGRRFRREKQKPKKAKDGGDGQTEDTSEWRYDIKEPFLSLAAGTTIERFSQVARVEDVHSGFLPRFALVVPKSRPGRRRDVGTRTVSMEATRNALAFDLQRIQGTPFVLRCEAAVFERFNCYTNDLEDEAGEAPNANLVAIVGARMSWMAFRIAMLLACTDPQQATVTVPHLLRGMAIAEDWRHTALRVLSSLAPSKFERLASRLVDLATSKPGITRREAMRALRTSKKEMNDVEATLLERGELRLQRRKSVGGEMVSYFPAQVSPLSQVSQGGSTEKSPPEPAERPGDTCDSVTLTAAATEDEPIDLPPLSLVDMYCNRCQRPWTNAEVAARRCLVCEPLQGGIA